MIWSSSRGAAHHGISSVIGVVLLVVAALFAAKIFVQRQETAQTYYPNQQEKSGVTITGPASNNAPAGVSVGATPSPSQSGITIGASTPTSPSDTAPTKTVTYTNGGFSPAALTIAGADAVTFINKADTSFSLASEVSLTNPGFAGFNAQSIIEPGQAITLWFPDEQRTYRYRNGRNSSQRGSIVVQ